MPGGHILDLFAEAVVANKQATLNQIDHAAFDATARLLADPGCRIYAVGGRITHAVVDYFGAVMRGGRAGVALAGEWPSHADVRTMIIPAAVPSEMPAVWRPQARPTTRQP
ncbi:MAG: hypothetical protein H7245_08410, partial [Candidatus Saccharibacteria bacterium]|nr:hypothetical protein [Pseudorhodobacter sp.]